MCLQCESKKSPLFLIFHFFHNGWEFLIKFTHLLYIPMYARLQIFIQLSLTLTKLYHIKRDYLIHINMLKTKCPPSKCMRSGVCVSRW